ncbi:hypothetical protein GCM10007385_18170 [Tateyamaria omphalii]|uniref:hypothetical protein n=1 Tax=Tateyamaria omphalii TaxID=299262 RepID=UPI001679499D|nr:hypothetical protein [Tateyamaria omphalii]GGX50156.1 hypothetical protein GCM10007385_18170 [Tateyamaria omphalii]
MWKIIPRLLLGAPLAASPIAEVICAPTDQMQARLKQQFGTTRTATGMRSPEEMMEVWTDSRGDWTMVVRYASGTSCIVAMGEHWSEVKNPA